MSEVAEPRATLTKPLKLVENRYFFIMDDSLLWRSVYRIFSSPFRAQASDSTYMLCSSGCALTPLSCPAGNRGWIRPAGKISWSLPSDPRPSEHNERCNSQTGAIGDAEMNAKRVMSLTALSLAC